jgi:hypothetical protein
MGHYAQYRKRGSTSTGSIYPAPPPGPEDWETDYSGTNIRVKYVVDPPAPANRVRTEYKPLAGEWQLGLGGSIKDNWFVISADDPPGEYLVRIRWALGGTFLPVSDWSESQPVTVT